MALACLENHRAFADQARFLLAWIVAPTGGAKTNLFAKSARKFVRAIVAEETDLLNACGIKDKMSRFCIRMGPALRNRFLNLALFGAHRSVPFGYCSLIATTAPFSALS